MKKVILVILDGWGNGPDTAANAIRAAKTPFMDSLLKKYPVSQLRTSGEDVGLPEGQMGNSEVGHLNLGAGRIVYQDLVKINKAIREKTIDHNPELLACFEYIKKSGKKLHFMGLLSKGGIHSHEQHLFRLLELAREHGIENKFLHCFTDGRDTDPESGIESMGRLKDKLKETGGKVASVCGRYYAMDRDKRWERIRLAYDLLVKGKGKAYGDPSQAILDSYKEKVTDEFIKPVLIESSPGNPVATIEPGDAVICFNFRTDRCREISMVLTQKDMPEQEMHTIPLFYVTMSNYDESFRNVHVLFHKDNLGHTLGEVLEANNRTQLRIAETEKYPHVTFFFSGGREQPFSGEERILVPSKKVATYDLYPAMSAVEIKDAVVPVLDGSAGRPQPDFVCLNFANPDMVGHTGVFHAVVEAIEVVDNCLQAVINAAMRGNYSALIIADHGNADFMINPDGSPHTAHTLNPVPCILVDENITDIKSGRLCDVAPTILKLMGIEKPAVMEGISLV